MTHNRRCLIPLLTCDSFVSLLLFFPFATIATLIPLLLPGNQKINFRLILEPSSMGATAAPDFTFITRVNSSNPEDGADVEDNEVVIGIPIRVEVNMTVNGFVVSSCSPLLPSSRCSCLLFAFFLASFSHTLACRLTCL